MSAPTKIAKLPNKFGKDERRRGNKVISLIGAKSKDFFFLKERMERVSDEVLYSTDDGSFAHHGFVTDLLRKVLKRKEKIALNAASAFTLQT